MVLAFKKYFTQSNQKNASWFQEQEEMSVEEKIKRVDLLTLFFSIVSFTLFNICYWCLTLFWWKAMQSWNTFCCNCVWKYDLVMKFLMWNNRANITITLKYFNIDFLGSDLPKNTLSTSNTYFLEIFIRLSALSWQETFRINMSQEQ